jgi:hypothetical protein
MQRVIETLQNELNELSRLPPEGYYAVGTVGHTRRLKMLELIKEHEAAIALLKSVEHPAPSEVTRYHRLAAVAQVGYGEIIKNNPEHWAYKFVEGENAYGCSNEGLLRMARRFAEFEASGQAIAYQAGYSGGFYDGKHNSSEHSDNPYLPKAQE